jgi:S-adenosylmethionine-diacylgycerolhomoserine-N-methlytransferase
MTLHRLIQDLPVLFEIAKPTKKTGNLTNQLDARYQGQSRQYDSFRGRLLYGREQLLDSIIPENFSGHWLDIGGGTGWNIEYALPKLNKNAQVTLIDLCTPLLNVAEERFQSLNHPGLSIRKDNACTFKLNKKVDLITFSYSLSMIPDWFQAIENAKSHLTQDGMIGVVDFYRPRKNEQLESNTKIDSWLNRSFIPWWFSHDNVFLNHDLVPFLQYHFKVQNLKVNTGKIPYTPLKAPYFYFSGKNHQ